MRCTYDPASRGGNSPDGRKVKATLHWVSEADAVTAEVRLYNQLFTRPDPDAANFAADLNPQSLEVLSDCKLESALAKSNSGEPVQFERQGYFCPDRGQHAAKAGFQPDRRASRYLRENRRQRLSRRPVAKARFTSR